MEECYIEINGAAGGDESKLFANELASAYIKFAAKNGIKSKMVSTEPVKIKLTGNGCYDLFYREGGVHRVQRVPKTETRGRIHTSTVTVAVFKEQFLAAIQIRPEDIEITTCRSSGKGGQHVNKTNSRVQIRHKPTGIMVDCQEERSQIQNREKAMEKLLNKLKEIEEHKNETTFKTNIKAQVGTGNRNEKIRTYNFKDNRITDHIYNFSMNCLDSFMAGNCEKFFNKIIEKESEIDEQ